MNNDLMSADQSRSGVSRRRVMVGGAIAGLAGTLGFSAVTKRVAQASSQGSDAANDAEILNGCPLLEHQAIWAYSAAAGGLRDTDVGKAWPLP